MGDVIRTRSLPKLGSYYLDALPSKLATLDYTSANKFLDLLVHIEKKAYTLQKAKLFEQLLSLAPKRIKRLTVEIIESAVKEHITLSKAISKYTLTRLQTSILKIASKIGGEKLAPNIAKLLGKASLKGMFNILIAYDIGRMLEHWAEPATQKFKEFMDPIFAKTPNPQDLTLEQEIEILNFLRQLPMEGYLAVVRSLAGSNIKYQPYIDVDLLKEFNDIRLETYPAEYTAAMEYYKGFNRGMEQADEIIANGGMPAPPTTTEWVINESGYVGKAFYLDHTPEQLKAQFARIMDRIEQQAGAREKEENDLRQQAHENYYEIG
ncbi:MAG: hypothetical protein NTW04_04940 [Elusimicrobia bacterium]|nr:hypothetical protein [Elusimicrobiota bacterium]